MFNTPFASSIVILPGYLRRVGRVATTIDAQACFQGGAPKRSVTVREQSCLNLERETLRHSDGIPAQ